MFRAVTDLVTIPVSVRAGDAPVTGLTAADFIVAYRQVEQQIERVDSESLPIDVTLIVDTSGSTDQVLGNLRDDAREIASVLRAQGRLQLLTIDTYAGEVLPLQPMTPAVSFDRPVTSGLSSVHDALALAMLVRGQPERRRLVVAMTDGVDSISALGAGALTTVGQVSDAVLEVFLIDTITERRERMIFRCAKAGLCGPDKRFWLPYQDRDVEPLRRVAIATGGDLRMQGSFRDRSAVGMFKQAFEDFRRSYFIRYSPRGVERQGWHPVEVRLRSRQGAPNRVVRARPGYFIGARPPEAAPLLPLGPGALPATLPALIRAFDQDDFSAVNEGLSIGHDIRNHV